MYCSNNSPSANVYLQLKKLRIIGMDSFEFRFKMKEVCPINNFFRTYVKDNFILWGFGNQE